MLNKEILSKLSLDVEDYDNISVIYGTIDEVDDDDNILIKSDGVSIPTIFHPKVLELYKEQEYELSPLEEVDVVGTFIIDEGELKVLVLRCISYGVLQGKKENLS